MKNIFFKYLTAAFLTLFAGAIFLSSCAMSEDLPKEARDVVFSDIIYNQKTILVAAKLSEEIARIP